MSKVYDTNGNKMSVQNMLEELRNNSSYATPLAKALDTDNSKSIKNSQMRLAHAILDSYKSVDGTTPEGERARKILDNLMTKYQKSNGTPSTEDNSAYHSFICDTLKTAGLLNQENLY
jgi:hypothetical protein